MALAPARVTGGATGDALTVDLTYPGTATDLTNIDAQSFVRDVIHEVQTESSMMRPYVTTTTLKGTFEWRFLTGKRDPLKRTQAIPDLNPRKQEFTTFGITVNAYDDDFWLEPYAGKNSMISISREIVKAQEMGYERLFDRLALSSLVVDVRTRTTSAWKQGAVSTGVRSLPVARIGGKIATVGANKVLADPDFDTLQRVGLKFWNNNVGRGTKVYATLTPNMEYKLNKLAQYYDKDYIFARRDDAPNKSIPFARFEWVAITPEVSLGAYMANYYIANAADSSLADAQTSSTNGFDLNPNNHECIGFWTKKNVYVGTCPELDIWSVFPVPSKRNTPVMIKTRWLGASRAQDILVYILCIPPN